MRCTGPGCPNSHFFGMQINAAINFLSFIVKFHCLTSFGRIGLESAVIPHYTFAYWKAKTSINRVAGMLVHRAHTRNDRCRNKHGRLPGQELR
jgi:hypothetical protein